MFKAATGMKQRTRFGDVDIIYCVHMDEFPWVLTCEQTFAIVQEGRPGESEGGLGDPTIEEDARNTEVC